MAKQFPKTIQNFGANGKTRTFENPSQLAKAMLAECDLIPVAKIAEVTGITYQTVDRYDRIFGFRHEADPKYARKTAKA